MNVHAILSALLALGPKLPGILAHVENIVAEVQAIIAEAKGEQTFAVAAPTEMSVGEQALCEQATDMLAQHNETEHSEGLAAYGAPGDRIKQLLAFLQAHPELVSLILSLLK
jgi:hypothetical protein